MVTTLGAQDLVLCSGTLRRRASFHERISAALAGGFAGMSLWGRDYRLARAEGLGDSDLLAMIEDNGLSVAEMDLAWSWLPGAAEVRIPPALDDQDVFCFSEVELFAIARTIGARSVNAVDVFGGSWTLDDAAEAFAALCRRAAEHDLLVQLEFVPWSRIPDLRTAWEIVKSADQPNGGITVDSWHYFRGTPDAALLATIPGQVIVGVQLSDGPALAERDLVQATLHERLLPGDGEMDLRELLTCLRLAGSEAPIGVEVFSDALHELEPVEAATRAGEAARRVL